MAAPGFTLDNTNRPQLAQWLDQGDWVVACLCAAWCDTCCSYRSGFDQLAEMHPDKRFVWIDIEDQADFIGDLDVENFPTLLIQRGDHVAFFGTVLPDVKLADRLVRAQAEKTDDMLRAEADESAANAERQRLYNLRDKLEEA
ncbi:thioredoxin family protein [Noviherbaspirillum sp.]|uniref:thioredoxin family protein n=1 Tax=Noviherbaspirillum sp. TaxID=1926288 RepID=UPI002FE2A950